LSLATQNAIKHNTDTLRSKLEDLFRRQSTLVLEDPKMKQFIAHEFTHCDYVQLGLWLKRDPKRGFTLSSEPYKIESIKHVLRSYESGQYDRGIRLVRMLAKMIILTEESDVSHFDALVPFPQYYTWKGAKEAFEQGKIEDTRLYFEVLCDLAIAAHFEEEEYNCGLMSSIQTFDKSVVQRAIESLDLQRSKLQVYQDLLGMEDLSQYPKHLAYVSLFVEFHFEANAKVE